VDWRGWPTSRSTGPWATACAAAPLLRVVGNQELARAVGAFAHGMVQLELARRFPPDADLDTAWREGT
jgi:hypothetical protein